MWVYSEFGAKIIRRNKEDAFDFTVVRVRLTVYFAEKYMTQLVLRAGIIEFSLVAKVINEFELRCDIELIVQASQRRDRQGFTAPRMAATTV